MVNQDAVAALLKELRLRAGLSQAQLGRRLRHSATWVSKIELSERGIDVHDVTRWAIACGQVVHLSVREAASDSDAAVHELVGEAIDPLVERLNALIPKLGARDRLLLEAAADVLERALG